MQLVSSGKSPSKSGPKKIGEVFLFPPKRNSDIEDLHFLLNLNFPCFFHKNHIPSISRCWWFLKSPLRWGSATLTISGPKGPPDSSMPMGPNSYHQICGFSKVSMKWIPFHLSDPLLCYVWTWRHCLWLFSHRCFMWHLLHSSKVEHCGKLWISSCKNGSLSSSVIGLQSAIWKGFVIVRERFDTFWSLCSCEQKHRKGSCFFRPLDKTLKQFDHLFHTRTWHLRFSLKDSMNFGSAWYFSSAAADSRATRNTLVFQWKPQWERKLGSIKHWFRTFHVTIMIAYVHSTIFSIACSASPSDRKFRAMVLTWSSEQCISNQAKNCMELASG